MTGFEAPLVAGLASLLFNTVKETAQEESGSTLARWLKTDVGKKAESLFFQVSNQYYRNYQERHGTLKVVCVRMDTPMQLEEIYTAVRLIPGYSIGQYGSVDGLQALFRESGRRGFRGSSDGKQDGIAIANQEKFLMVLGGPGIGKSTFLRKVGLEALKSKDVNHTGRPRSQYQPNCVPVFLPLQQFKSTERTIEQRIAEEFDTCGFPEPEAVTQALLKKGRLLVLLDGLDEVPADQESAVIEQIRDFVDRYSNNRFIVSCRVAAYKGGFPRFKDVAMAEFEDEQIEQFIRKWFRAAKDLENQTAEQCWELLNRPEYAAAKELAQTPLLLTLLCGVYDKSQDFPKNRAALYGEALDVVLKEWAAEKRIHNDPIYRDLPIELERGLLAEIAYDSFMDDQLFFDKRDVTHRIREFLVSNLNAPGHLDSERVLEAIEVQQGILVERARDTYSFSHLTFQEYLVAQHIDDNQQIEWLVTNHATDEQWREVFLLVAGLMRGRSGADELLLQMEKQAQQYINTPKLKALLNWAHTATDGSEGDYKPAAKRAVAIFLALDPARASARVLALDLDIVLARVLALDAILDLARSRASALDVILDLDIVLDLDIALALDFEKIKIFKSVDLLDLVQQLEGMKSRVPDNNQHVLVRYAFAEEIWQVWLAALHLDPEVAKLSEDEAKALENCLYINELMVRCKEAAVRVSPQVWAGIEERMLKVGMKDEG